MQTNAEREDKAVYRSYAPAAPSPQRVRLIFDLWGVGVKGQIVKLDAVVAARLVRHGVAQVIGEREETK